MMSLVGIEPAPSRTAAERTNRSTNDAVCVYCGVVGGIGVNGFVIFIVIFYFFVRVSLVVELLPLLMPSLCLFFFFALVVAN